MSKKTAAAWDVNQVGEIITIIRCSGCGKNNGEAVMLVEISSQVYICDDCVDLCHELVSEKRAEKKNIKKKKK